MFLNFHTHSKDEPAEGKAVSNIIVGVDEARLAGNSWFSAGLHPWYFDEADFAGKLVALERIAAQENLKLIGECGLDRLKGPALSLQQEVFEAQIRIAERVRKPVVVHCVKCFSELLAVKKRLNPVVQMIVHGFNNKPETGRQLLDAGFYFSLGAALMRPGSNAGEFLKQLPLDRLFLETDDKKLAVEEVYKAAAGITKTTLNELKDTIFANWMSLQSGTA